MKEFKKFTIKQLQNWIIFSFALCVINIVGSWKLLSMQISLMFRHMYENKSIYWLEIVYLNGLLMY